MGTNCALLFADLFLFSYETKFLDSLIVTRSAHKRLARSFNFCYRHINSLTFFNSKKLIDHVKEIYPSELDVEKANSSYNQAN